MKIKEHDIQKNNVGNAGEYYIASRLSAENFITTITLGRAEKYDIIAVNQDNKTIKISVKTRYLENIERFPLSVKDETGGASDFYYAFVKLNEFKTEPEFWIIPSERVGNIIYDAHKKWLAGSTKTQRTDTDIRNLWLKINTTSRPLYPSNWEEELRKYYKNIEQLK